MDSIIDQLKERDAVEERLHQTDKIRLRNVEVLRAKLPNFWTALIEQTRTICAELRKEFPHKKERHYNVIMRGTGFRLDSQGPYPQYSLLIQCDFAASFLNYIEIIQNDPYHGESEGLRGEIRIKVRPDDESLVFFYKNDQYDSPNKLAESFVMQVIQQASSTF